MTKHFTPGVRAALAAGQHLHQKDGGDVLQVLSKKFGDHADETLKQIGEVKIGLGGVKAHLDELEQRMARDGGGGLTPPETWGTEFVRAQGGSIKALSETNKGAVNLVIKAVTTGVSSGGALKFRTVTFPLSFRSGG